MTSELSTHDLECEAISKRFGSIKAVDNVSFQIPSGSFFSILGPSGCGKTTLMRMIAGFENPDTGDIKIKGQSVLDIAPNKRNVKMVFQHLALFPMMNVFENIAYGLRCNGVATSEIKSKVADVLDRVALPDVANREIHQLSGGQKQRIAIARCMALNPDVLLLDEPLGALDLKLREAMKIELKLLQHKFNTTFVYITHDQSEALVMSDHVAVMNLGRFEQIGTPQELYHNPATAFVAGFVGDSNQWSGDITHRNGQHIEITTPDGFRIAGTSNAHPEISQTNATAFVRPEFIKLNDRPTEANTTGINNMTGQIDSLLFNGANSRLLVRGNSDQLIEADITLTGGLDDPKAGDTVHLSWPSQQTLCFC